MTAARVTVRMHSEVSVWAQPDLAASLVARREYQEIVDYTPETCTWCERDGCFVSVRLTPDPVPDLFGALTEQMEVCECCAGRDGHLIDRMRGESRSRGDISVELLQANGRWA